MKAKYSGINKYNPAQINRDRPNSDVDIYTDVK